MIYALWAFVLLIGGMFLYLSGASMLGTYLKQRGEADEQEARRILWRSALKDSEDTYGEVLRSRAEKAP